eukprot:scaffold74197_cov15-Tisochrysis_lutea.AAC.1
MRAGLRACDCDHGRARSGLWEREPVAFRLNSGKQAMRCWGWEGEPVVFRLSPGKQAMRCWGALPAHRALVSVLCVSTRCCVARGLWYERWWCGPFV